MIQYSSKALFFIAALLLTQLSCSAGDGSSGGAALNKGPVENTCSGTYPAYWQDMNPRFQAMWAGQTISNAPTEGWTGPIFQLSDKYPVQPVDDKDNQPWWNKRYDALFDGTANETAKVALATEYAWHVMTYIQAGNLNRPGKEDFDLCENAVRPWFHIPFQTYDAMSGREFIHGLTREAPVTFSVKSASGFAVSSMWAVGFYNATAAYTLGTMWTPEGVARIPVDDIKFDEGAVIAKPLFNTSSIDELPVLANMPNWNANISDPVFCKCTSKTDKKECTLIEESKQCPRSHANWNNVSLLQFDIAVKDSRAKNTQWVYGTFVADGLRKKRVKEPWNRISLLGLMWGNDTPGKGEFAYNTPKDVRKNGFKEEVIIWDTVDELNRASGTAVARKLGHLGCNQRLNGPADNANSSCMSCHGTASVPDKNLLTPALISQFSAQTKQCVSPVMNQAQVGVDRSGASASTNNDIDFSEIDGIYFANTAAGAPFNMTVSTPDGPKYVMGKGVPTYADAKRTDWISLDYSLQSSIALKQWMQWQAHQNEAKEVRIVDKELRR